MNSLSQAGDPPVAKNAPQESLAAPEEKTKHATSNGSSFRCYICDEPSEEICVHCTRDACNNHLCEKCGQCSDCCQCGDRPR